MANDSIDSMAYQMALRKLEFERQLDLANMANAQQSSMSNAFTQAAAQMAHGNPFLQGPHARGKQVDVSDYQRRLDSALRQVEQLGANFDSAMGREGYAPHETSALAICLVTPFYARPREGSVHTAPLHPMRRPDGGNTLIGQEVMLPGCGLFTVQRQYDPDALCTPEIWPASYNTLVPQAGFPEMSFTAKCALGVALALQFARQEASDAEIELKGAERRAKSDQEMMRHYVDTQADILRKKTDNLILQQLMTSTVPAVMPKRGIIDRVLGLWDADPSKGSNFDKMVEVGPMPPLLPKPDV